jgi:hypothetical protein
MRTSASAGRGCTGSSAVSPRQSGSSLGRGAHGRGAQALGRGGRAPGGHYLLEPSKGRAPLDAGIAGRRNGDVHRACRPVPRDGPAAPARERPQAVDGPADAALVGAPPAGQADQVTPLAQQGNTPISVATRRRSRRRSALALRSAGRGTGDDELPDYVSAGAVEIPY